MFVSEQFKSASNRREMLAAVKRAAEFATDQSGLLDMYVGDRELEAEALATIIRFVALRSSGPGWANQERAQLLASLLADCASLLAEELDPEWNAGPVCRLCGGKNPNHTEAE